MIYFSDKEWANKENNENWNEENTEWNRHSQIWRKESEILWKTGKFWRIYVSQLSQKVY